MPDTHVFKMVLTPAGPLIKTISFYYPQSFPSVSKWPSLLLIPSQSDSGRMTLVPSIRMRGVEIRLAVLSVHHAQGPSTRIPIAENLHSEACDHGLLGICKCLFLRSEFNIW